MLIKLQIIGSYLENLKKPLNNVGIELENIIGWINPLSVMDIADPEVEHYSQEIKDRFAVLDIKKNLPNMLAHDEKKFESNVKYYNLGEIIRCHNNSDYVLVYNNMFNYPMFIYNDRLYTDRYPRNVFTESIKNSQKKILKVPFPEKFNWKFYYDRFIDVLLSEYDPDHIILLKTSMSSWYIKNGSIEMFDRDSIDNRQFAEKADMYFVEKTQCRVIDFLAANVPLNNDKCASPYSQRDINVLERLTEIISESIQKEHDYIKDCCCGNIGGIINKINSNAFFEYKEYFEKIKKIGSFSSSVFSNITVDNIVKDAFSFVKNNELCTLSDCLINHSHIFLNQDLDYKKLFAYTKFFKCDINDILAIYKLYTQYNSQYDFSSIIKNITSQKDSVPICESINFRERNRRKLLSYPYVPDNIDIIFSDDEYYINLNSSMYIVLNHNSIVPICLYNKNKNDSSSFDDIKNNCMRCEISDVESIISSLNFYIERARQGFGNTPVILSFETINDFVQSLQCYNYSDILENEYFVIRIANFVCSEENYKARTNLEFLFDKNSTICTIHDGLGNQIYYYLFSKAMSENTSRIVYYDDLYFQVQQAFSGLEIQKIISEDISHRLFSNIFSCKLINELVIRNECACVPNALFNAGYKELLYVTDDGRWYKNIQCDSTLLFKGKEYNVLKQLCMDNMYCKIMPYPEYYDLNYSDFFAFPNFQDDKNKEIFNDILTYDSVIIHVRRGDFVSLGWEADMDYYKESLEKLKNIDDYENKKFFIFSDDITWCKNNIEEFGLDVFPNAEIVYVDHNVGSESYRDLQLMSYGKIIIGSNSTLVRAAALISMRCELFMCYNQSAMSVYEKKVRKNKYQIGPYKKKYETNYFNTSSRKV